MTGSIWSTTYRVTSWTHKLRRLPSKLLGPPGPQISTISLPTWMTHNLLFSVASFSLQDHQVTLVSAILVDVGAYPQQNDSVTVSVRRAVRNICLPFWWLQNRGAWSCHKPFIMCWLGMVVDAEWWYTEPQSSTCVVVGADPSWILKTSYCDWDWLVLARFSTGRQLLADLNPRLHYPGMTWKYRAVQLTITKCNVVFFRRLFPHISVQRYASYN